MMPSVPHNIQESKNEIHEINSRRRDVEMEFRRGHNGKTSINNSTKQNYKKL